MSETLVIIPTLNEIENIEDIIHAVFKQKNEYDVLVVDDKSLDGTPEKVKELQSVFVNRLFLMKRNGPKGLGRAYIDGFKWALEKDYQYVIEMDADFSHDPNDLDRLNNTCKQENLDVVVGSRYINGVNVVNWPMKRVLLSFFASKYVKFITGISINDTTAGFVCYSSRFLKSLNLENIMFVGYAFQIEMKYKAWKKGFSLKEISVIFTDRTKGKSKMNGSIINEAVFGVIKLALNGNKIKKHG
ncbi:MAG: polyprenol monophosphomannose synthase [Flavobacteriaceae bacterium]